MVVTLIKGLIVAMVTVPMSIAAILAIPLPGGRLFHAVARNWAKFILWIFGIKVTVHGLRHLGSSRHYIYVSNHASMFDIPAVLSGIPDEIRIVLKKELTKVPIWGWALKYGHYISIDRDNPKDAVRSLERAAETVRNGASVLLFAEGTRSRDGALHPFKRGAFSLAARSGIPIMPVAIKGTFRILPKGSWKVAPADVSLVLDAPIPTKGMSGKEGEIELMERVHHVIERNLQ
jgi:1-acyl-sn-glycerol-3-phosphate acyltransferase